jgi:hypothetical protein
VVRVGMGGNISKFQGFYNMDKICIFPYPFAAATASGLYGPPRFAGCLLGRLRLVPILPDARGQHLACLQQRGLRG